MDLIAKAEGELFKKQSLKKGDAVHNARKKLKQARGLLRLARPGLKSKAYTRINKALRNAGRPLSEIRDAYVLLETFQNLLDSFPDVLSERSVNRIRTLLQQRRSAIRKNVIGKENAIEDVEKNTRKAEKQIGKSKTDAGDFSIIMSGAESIYSRGRREMAQALQHDSDEELHRWRKSVKYLRYQLEWLQHENSGWVSEGARQAKELSDILGLDHDVAVLKILVEGELNPRLKPQERKRLLDLADRKREELKKTAFEIGSALYARSPQGFLDHLEADWSQRKQSSTGAASVS